jgi:hypothetical protein
MLWTDLVQNRDHWRALMNTVKNLEGSQKVRKFLNGCAIGGFSRKS